jgi:hypothetical protein
MSRTARLGAAALLLASAAACRPRAGPAGAAPGADASHAPCADLTARLCATLGPDPVACAYVHRDLTGRPPAYCAFLLEHSAEAVAEVRRRASARAALARAGRSGRRGPAPALGSPDARITLVVFTDFSCDDCARGAPLAATVGNLYPGGTVELVFRQFPRRGNAEARLAAEASLAAQAQGRFWRYQEILFSNQHDLSRRALERYGRDAGLDLARLRRDLDDGRYTADVDDDVALGQAAGVTTPPALFVNGRRVAFPFGVAELRALVAEALAS